MFRHVLAGCLATVPIIPLRLWVSVHRFANIAAALIVRILRSFGDGAARRAELLLGFVDEVFGCALLGRRSGGGRADLLTIVGSTVFRDAHSDGIARRERLLTAMVELLIEVLFGVFRKGLVAAGHNLTPC